MLFAYELGRQANMEHFRNPGAYPFIQLSPEIYLQEHVMRRMPKRVKGCGVINNIVDFLKEKSLSCNAIIEYFAYLETICGISNLKPENFEDYYDFLRVNYNLTDCTALHHHRLMKQALSYGVKKGPLMYNIMDKVDAPDDSDFQGDYYRASEALELLEKAKGDTLYIVVLLTTFYGFRRSEVLGLRWTAIDFEANVINVERKIVVTSRHGKREYQDKKKMKSQSSRRTLPLIDIVREALLIEKKKQEEYKKAFGKAYHDNKEGYICVDPLGKLITPDYVTGHFEVLLKKSKMRKIRFHDLRHTCATLLVMNGVSLLLVSRWLGHSNMAVTEKYYLHFDVKSQIESAVKMGQILPHQLAEDVVQTFLHG